MKRGALRLAGIRAGERERVVRAMLLRRRRDAPGYWLNLMLSVGIATLGLALDSTAVVIGAMLVSPLMGPIVEFGMGLATGSPVLTLRSFARTGGGIVAAVLGAAALTTLLPFREITAEVAARTSPTALDLLIAVFVAVAAVFITVRSGMDTASTAAGTAIGISLVPPLCVTGFGIGSGNGAVAAGSAMLFLTNFTAIVSVAVLCFLVLGFERVETARWDHRALRTARGRGAHRAAAVLSDVFGSRYGRVLRVGIPLGLLAAVAVPLSDALEQVAWEVRARGLVSGALQELPSGDVVQSTVSVRGRSVAARLYVLGTPAEAAALERGLTRRIREGLGTDPTVRVVAVPHATAQAAASPVASDPAAERAELAALRDRLDAALREAWAATGAGEIVEWGLVVGDSARTHAAVLHLGAPVATGTTGLLAQVVSDAAGFPVRIVPEAVPELLRSPSTSADSVAALLGRAERAMGRSGALFACASVPERGLAPDVAGLVEATASRAPPGRWTVASTGDSLGIRLQLRPCAPAPAPAPAPAAPPPG